MTKQNSKFIYKPEERVELTFDPYHGSVLPLNYSGVQLIDKPI
ncbi:MAG: hypothetical protein G01um101433_802 [Parcubacteria group bacterium Gr01-1014_33]|nr:MAG: hypothetical protein G01um101433_802 [Parcubacteria group bacterium Gr01-1014_33]